MKITDKIITLIFFTSLALMVIGTITNTLILTLIGAIITALMIIFG